MQTKITFAGRSGLGSTTLGRDARPREHAPVVRGQRVRGGLQPDVLEGRLGDRRRVPQHGPHRGERRRRPGHAGRERGLRHQPDQPVQHELRDDQQYLLDSRAVEPDRRQSVLHRQHLHPPGHRLPRPAPDPRRVGLETGVGPLDRRDEADPERVSAAAPSPRRSSRTSSTSGCRTRARPAARSSTQFFTQWFDTAYPTPNNATNKPQITGPGINGPDHFYDDASACTRADQTITFGPLPNRSPGDPDFTVSATSDSGLPVSFAASRAVHGLRHDGAHHRRRVVHDHRLAGGRRRLQARHAGPPDVRDRPERDQRRAGRHGIGPVQRLAQPDRDHHSQRRCRARLDFHCRRPPGSRRACRWRSTRPRMTRHCPAPGRGRSPAPRRRPRGPTPSRSR